MNARDLIEKVTSGGQPAQALQEVFDPVIKYPEFPDLKEVIGVAKSIEHASQKLMEYAQRGDAMGAATLLNACITSCGNAAIFLFGPAGHEVDQASRHVQSIVTKLRTTLPK